MKKVYAVGVMQLDTSPNAKRVIVSERLWSLYANFEDAEKCVLENRGDIFEYYYNYALIESIHVIDPSQVLIANEDWFPPKEWWYEIKYGLDVEDSPVITKIDKPSCLEKMVYFWVG